MVIVAIFSEEARVKESQGVVDVHGAGKRSGSLVVDHDWHWLLKLWGKVKNQSIKPKEVIYS
jgi:hypothetical protein